MLASGAYVVDVDIMALLSRVIIVITLLRRDGYRDILRTREERDWSLLVIWFGRLLRMAAGGLLSPRPMPPLRGGYRHQSLVHNTVGGLSSLGGVRFSWRRNTPRVCRYQHHALSPLHHNILIRPICYATLWRSYINMASLSCFGYRQYRMNVSGDINYCYCCQYDGCLTMPAPRRLRHR